MKLFDIVNTPLSGINLIEASAGTGKTYAIEGLYVRLIVEKTMPVDRILVVTFTRAAAGELKERIRKKLLSAKDAFNRNGCDDPVINALVTGLNNKAQAKENIQNALINFDEAAIFTIHGFCQKLLNENSFETNSPFASEIISDQIDLFKEIAEDFWRLNFYSAPPELSFYAINRLSGPEWFKSLLNKLNYPDINIIPDITMPKLETLDNYRTIVGRLKTIWAMSKQNIISLLMNPSLNGKIYGALKPSKDNPDITNREIKLEYLARSMDRLTSDISLGFPLFEKFELLTSGKISASATKSQVPPAHEFFETCDGLYKASARLESEMDQYLMFLKARFLKYAKNELGLRKKNANVIGFDDLLVIVRNALNEKVGDFLIKTLRKRYKAALIDEFQDTDSLQYEIFSRIFGSKDSILFMIGDPKQAIYGFRGADIFSYMDAASSVENPLTLQYNWRSTPELITAVNTIFTNRRNPFLFKKISFNESIPGQKTPHPGPLPQGERDVQFNKELNKKEPAMVIWHLFSDEISEKNKAVPKNKAIDLVSEAVANEIAKLAINGIRYGDIAVLTRTNKQALIIKQSLSNKNIPSVLFNSGNIFLTDEASEILKILLAVANPGDSRLIKAALSSDMIGGTADMFESDDSKHLSGTEDPESNFARYLSKWKQCGFIHMFRLLLFEEKVKKRIMMHKDGERRLTNILHLSEIIHQADNELNPGIYGLIKWLKEHIENETVETEEHLLRLESDEYSVQIVTIHKSKGLEYEMVFCPFMWDSSEIDENAVTFHDPGNKDLLTLDLGSAAFIENKIFAQNELLAENLRILYVALTRARKKCYLVWGPINNAETSALAYLFHYDPDYEHDYTDDIVKSLKENFRQKDHEKLFADLNAISDRSVGTITLSELPMNGIASGRMQTQDFENNLSFKNFSKTIDRSWKIASFSSLASGKSFEYEVKDRDFQLPGSIMNLEVKVPEKDIYGISNFPKGSGAGLFFHDLFEHIDFTACGSEITKSMIDNKLRSYGFDLAWKPAVHQLIENVVSTKLNTEGDDIILSSISLENRINEMEFYYPIKKISHKTFSDFFKKHANQYEKDFFPQIEDLSFSPVYGYMKGYIDMIFFFNGRYYLVDWKSNCLGLHITNYGKSALINEIKENHYEIQYLIYVLALHKYLAKRICDYSYEKNFGGVFYLFIRGISSQYGPEYGVFYDLPEPNSIYELEEVLYD